MQVHRSFILCISLFHQKVAGTTHTIYRTKKEKQKGLTENDGHGIDGHAIGGQDIYRLKIDYITMQCAILFKTTAEYKSQQRGKLCRPPVIVE